MGRIWRVFGRNGNEDTSQQAKDRDDDDQPGPDAADELVDEAPPADVLDRAPSAEPSAKVREADHTPDESKPGADLAKVGDDSPSSAGKLVVPEAFGHADQAYASAGPADSATLNSAVSGSNACASLLQAPRCRSYRDFAGTRSKTAIPVHSEPVPQVVGQATCGGRGPGTGRPSPMGAFT